MKNVEQLRMSPVVRWGVFGVAGALALTACSNGESQPQPTVTVTQEAKTDDPEMTVAPSAEPVLPSTSNGGPGYTASYQFNYRGGNSQIIRVYPGTSESAEDRVKNGQYYSGETYSIECQEQGRTVETTPGEEYAKSDVWYRLLTGNNPVEYASKTYGDVTIPKGVDIPTC